MAEGDRIERRGKKIEAAGTSLEISAASSAGQDEQRSTESISTGSNSVQSDGLSHRRDLGSGGLSGDNRGAVNESESENHDEVSTENIASNTVGIRDRIHPVGDHYEADSLVGSVVKNESEILANNPDANLPDGHLPVLNPSGNSVSEGVAGGGVGVVEVNAESDHSPIRGDYSTRENPPGEIVDLAAFRSKVTIHSSAVFETKKWKRSRVKDGHLIARIKGYDPVESEYGVSYLKVVKRNPKKTSGDYSLYEHAGFFTWRALQASGRLVKERKRNGESRISGNRARTS